MDFELGFQETLEQVREELRLMTEKQAKTAGEVSDMESKAGEKEREDEEDKRRQLGEVKTLETRLAQLVFKNDELNARVEELQVRPIPVGPYFMARYAWSAI
jgi:hypothetical protein